MANRTDKEAASIHGTNPQNLIEYIIRQKVYDSLYWKHECFGLSAERLVDKAVGLRCAGGMFGEPQKPTEFIALVLKMLQIQPDREIVLEFIKNDDFKYLRLLGAFYLRLTGRPLDIFRYLEPLLNDYRRVRLRAASGAFSLSHVDEVVDQMLRNDYLFNVALPKLPDRKMLEKTGQMEPRVSVLAEEFRALVAAEEDEQRQQQEAVKLAAKEAERQERQRKEKWRLGRRAETHDQYRRRRSRSQSRDRDEYRRRTRRDRSRSRSRSRDRGRYDSKQRARRSDDGADSSDGYQRDRREERRRSRSFSPERNAREKKRQRESRWDKEAVNKGANGKGDVGGGGGAGDSLSVEETNALRASLGLPPLK